MNLHTQYDIHRQNMVLIYKFLLYFYLHIPVIYLLITSYSLYNISIIPFKYFIFQIQIKFLCVFEIFYCFYFKILYCFCFPVLYYFCFPVLYCFYFSNFILFLFFQFYTFSIFILSMVYCIIMRKFQPSGSDASCTSED